MNGKFKLYQLILCALPFVAFVNLKVKPFTENSKFNNNLSLKSYEVLHIFHLH